MLGPQLADYITERGSQIVHPAKQIRYFEVVFAEALEGVPTAFRGFWANKPAHYGCVAVLPSGRPSSLLFCTYRAVLRAHNAPWEILQVGFVSPRKVERHREALVRENVKR